MTEGYFLPYTDNNDYGAILSYSIFDIGFINQQQLLQEPSYVKKHTGRKII